MSELILREINDPRVGGIVTITAVETSPDLRSARVYISVMGDAEEREQTITGLRSASRFLHRGLEDLSLRHVPELTFLADDSMERADRLMRLIDQAHHETDSGTDVSR